GAVLLHLAEAQLDRVAVVILGHAPQHQVATALPVRFAELPEAAADAVQPAGRHVHRAQAAMRGVAQRAELLRPPAGQRLAPVAAAEECQLVATALADGLEPFGRDSHRLVPLDLDKLATAALAHTLERLLQPRRRVVLHDPGRALGAEHALVHRMIGIALDVAQAAVLDVDADAAAAGA